jgi:hypothetical protein
MLSPLQRILWLGASVVGCVYFARSTWVSLRTGDAHLSRRYLPLKDVSWESEPQAYLLAVIISGGLSVFCLFLIFWILRAMIARRGES